MKKIFLSALIALCSGGTLMADPVITLLGSDHKVIEIEPAKSTGLNSIFVVYDCSNISEMLISGVSGNVNVQKYGNLGGGHAVPVPVTMTESGARVSEPKGNLGYIIENGGRYYYIWIVDYRQNQFTIQSVNPAPEQTCWETEVEMVGNGPAIHYYTIDGRQMELSREIEVQYTSMEWNESSESYSACNLIKTLNHLTTSINITPPVFASTSFTVTGDRFLREWGMEVKAESSVMVPNGIAIHTSATQLNEAADEDDDSSPSNMIKTEVNGMGGSAPCDIEFKAYGTEGVDHFEWQIASDPEFEYLQYQFYTSEIEYQFLDEGTYYVRCIGTDTRTHCEAIGETYTVSIGSSELLIPNAFTPNGDGINDEWKVSYRSLLNFRCWIFDRYGNELFQFTDPTMGWDGKYKGKLVNPGVYFYVIEATGADGKKFKRGGDINIIRSKNSNISNGGSSKN